MIKTQKTTILSIYYIIGLVSFFICKISVAAILLLFVTFFLIYKKIISARFSLVLYLIFVLGILNCHFRVKETDRLHQIAPKNATITGRIISIPTTNNKERTKFYANINKIEYDGEFENIKKNKLIVTIQDSPENLSRLKLGDTIRVNGKLSIPHAATNPSQFDYARYLRNFNTFTLFFAGPNSWNIVKNADTPYWKTLQNVNIIRNNVIEKHKANLKSPNIEVLGGMIFGDDAVNPPDEIKTSFMNSGLLHILAASGMNVTLIFGIWFFIAQKIRIHYKLSIITGILLIIFYTCMTGFGPPIMRASLMLIFILFGKLVNRDADNIALLFFVGFLLMLYNPALINNIGFQLSFVVTFGLLYTCPIIAQRIENKTINIIAGACLVPLIAQIYAAPIQMYYFNTFATYSIFANILIIPFLGIISFIGFISSMLALIPKISTYICFAADFVLNPFLSALVAISNFFAGLKNSLLVTKHILPIQIAFYYLLILNITYLIKDKFANKKLIISASALFLAGLLFLIPIRNKNCEIIFFDVGNADSALIKTPNDKYILIDSGKQPYKSGSTQADQIILKYLKDKGVKSLDSYIITHFDSDHAGGTIPILSNLKIAKVYISDSQDSTSLYYKIKQFMKDNNIKPLKVESDLNVLKEGNLELINLKGISNIAKENENSIITLLKYNDFKILFMADADANTFKTLKLEDAADVNILKIGHHGGKRTVSNSMLKAAKPKIAIISTGANPYGHPAKSTLDTIKSSNIKILRTDYNNAIKVVIKPDKTDVYTYRTKTRKFEKIAEIKKD